MFHLSFDLILANDVLRHYENTNESASHMSCFTFALMFGTDTGNSSQESIIMRDLKLCLLVVSLIHTHEHGTVCVLLSNQ